MLLAESLLGTSSTAANYIEDVFSTYLYTGTGSAQTITNSIDLSTKGGMVWLKDRTAANPAWIMDTTRGTSSTLQPSSTGAAGSISTAITAFGTTGFTIGTNSNSNTNGNNYVSWTFRKQAKFFDIVTYTGDGTTPRNISHNLGSVPGCIIIKNLTTAQTWPVYHRSLNIAGGFALRLNTTDASVNTGVLPQFFASTVATSTQFTVGNAGATNESGSTFVAYLFAHDAGGFGASGTDNVISCGSFTTDGSGNATVSLGYEPQWLLVKNATTASNNEWRMVDNMRGFPVNDASSSLLTANSSAAETTTGTINLLNTGFQIDGLANSATFIYIAIRRGPMKTPTSGTSVYTPVAWTATAAPATVTGFNFPVDLTWHGQRAGVFGSSNVTSWDRLRGAKAELYTGLTDAESTRNGVTGFDYMSAVQVSNPTAVGEVNYSSGNTEIFWGFRRAPGFFDVVCYTGTGSATTVSHNLGAVPGLMIVKSRDGVAKDWRVYAGDPTGNLELNSSAAFNAGASSIWNNTSPTASVFSVGNSTFVNESGKKFVNYLFGTVAGVSKVGSYTGTGTTKQIDCGFTGGARFVLIKRTDSTGDWYVWDSARGIVAGNDPYLLLNSTAAEVTGTDYIDTYSAGFEISSTAPAAINANGGSFIFLAIA